LLAGVVLAGLAAGYVMTIAGLWAGKVPRLVAFDIADFSASPPTSPTASCWSSLWATVIEPNLARPHPLEGLVWGEFLALTPAGSLVAPLSGLGFIGSRTGPSPICHHQPLFQRQNGLCPVCHQHLEYGEEIRIHHVIPKRHRGADNLVNLRLVHANCQRQIHSDSVPLGVRKLLEALQVDNFHLALHARVRMMIMFITQSVDITFTELYFEHLSTSRWDR
jgi:HNH endonuclease